MFFTTLSLVCESRPGSWCICKCWDAAAAAACTQSQDDGGAVAQRSPVLGTEWQPADN